MEASRIVVLIALDQKAEALIIPSLTHSLIPGLINNLVVPAQLWLCLPDTGDSKS